MKNKMVKVTLPTSVSTVILVSAVKSDFEIGIQWRQRVADAGATPADP